MDAGQTQLNRRRWLGTAAVLGLLAAACGLAPAGRPPTATVPREVTAWPTATERSRASASPEQATAYPLPTADLAWILDAELDESADYQDPPSIQYLDSDQAWIRFQPASELEIQVYYWPEDNPSVVWSQPFNPDVHGVVLPELSPETQYLAQPLVQRGETAHRLAFLGEPWGPLQFRTAAEDPTVVRFGVIGDSGFGDPVTSLLVQELARRDLDFVVHTGDIVYRGDENDGAAQAYALKFYRNFRPLLTTVPIYPAMGNHEFDLPVRLNDLPYYYQAFPRFPPELGVSSGGHLGRDWYAFEHGDWKFIFLNTQLFFGVPGSEDQLEWLRGRLETAPAQGSILAMHVPLYSAGRHQDDAAWVASNLSDLVNDYAVALTLAGHDHNYQRILREGVRHIVSGGGSRVLYDVGGGPGQEASASRSHVVLVELRDGEIEVVALDEDGIVFDQMTFPGP